MLQAQRPLVVGEVAQAHEGSLALAHAFIDAIGAAGADGVKFQTHIAAAESTPAEAWRVPFTTQDASRYDYWRRMEFSVDQWAGLRAHAHARGLRFLSSPFSVEAADLLAGVGVDAWKIASGELVHDALLDRVLADGRTVLLSTGMSPLHEIDAAVARVRAAGRAFAVLQCTSAYPVVPERVGLNLLDVFRRRYDCPVGLSDHSGTLFPSLAAGWLGAAILEVHVTLSRDMPGPDVPASLTPAELAQLVTGVRWMTRMQAAPVDKDAVARELAPMRQLFMKSVVARTALAEGTLLCREHLAVKKPGHGIPATRLSELVGRRLLRSIAPDELLSFADVGTPE
ncbi:MAG TPA: N-acetylneuraminate synthase family protein [Gemmatimonadales bacterium]|nr:N-acetylneuraminate synthase family protein [Gemmatimonadales bacterium]